MRARESESVPVQFARWTNVLPVLDVAPLRYGVHPTRPSTTSAMLRVSDLRLGDGWLFKPWSRRKDHDAGNVRTHDLD